MGMLSTFFDVNRQICGRLEDRFPNFFDSLQDDTTYLPEVRSQLETYTKGQTGARLLEAGGIDRPLILRGGWEYEYVGLDIEDSPRCYEVYDDFIVQSVEDPIPDHFDAIFSITLLEHVENNEDSARSLFNGLKPGGETIHYVPNMGHPYALLLRAVGNKVQRKLLEMTEGAETKGGGGGTRPTSTVVHPDR